MPKFACFALFDAFLVLPGAWGGIGAFGRLLSRLQCKEWPLLLPRRLSFSSITGITVCKQVHTISVSRKYRRIQNKLQRKKTPAQFRETPDTKQVRCFKKRLLPGCGCSHGFYFFRMYRMNFVSDACFGLLGAISSKK